jgi:hypothetical protein
MLNGLGIETELIFDRLIEAGNYISNFLERPRAPRSKASGFFDR